VYLCTTADREYACEAWRLLDPQGGLIPAHKLPERLLCVSHMQRKDVLNVLRLGSVLAAQQQAAATGTPPGAGGGPRIISDQGERRRRRQPLGGTGVSLWRTHGPCSQTVLTVVLPCLRVPMQSVPRGRRCPLLCR
jgi:hypothetical protein